METFIFNKLIDPLVLSDLYENDYTYIEKIFQTALANLEGDLEKLRFYQTSGNREGLTKAIHKLKPTFGFLGMAAIEQKCSLFEQKCRSTQSTGSLSADLDALLLEITAGKNAAEDDYRKLVIFNKT